MFVCVLDTKKKKTKWGDQEREREKETNFSRRKQISSMKRKVREILSWLNTIAQKMRIDKPISKAGKYENRFVADSIYFILFMCLFYSFTKHKNIDRILQWLFSSLLSVRNENSPLFLDSMEHFIANWSRRKFTFYSLNFYNSNWGR